MMSAPTSAVIRSAFADVTDSGHQNLTMYHDQSKCGTGKETLGLGDMLRAEAIY